MKARLVEGIAMQKDTLVMGRLCSYVSVGVSVDLELSINCFDQVERFAM